MKNLTRLPLALPAVLLAVSLYVTPAAASGPRACDIDGTPCDVPSAEPTPEATATPETVGTSTTDPAGNQDVLAEKMCSASAASETPTPLPTASAVPAIAMTPIPEVSPAPATSCAPTADDSHVGGSAESPAMLMNAPTGADRGNVSTTTGRPASETVQQTTEQPSTAVTESLPSEDLSPTEAPTDVAVTGTLPSTSQAAIPAAHSNPRPSHSGSPLTVLAGLLSVIGATSWKLLSSLR